MADAKKQSYRQQRIKIEFPAGLEPRPEGLDPVLGEVLLARPEWPEVEPAGCAWPLPGCPVEFFI